MQNTHSLKPLAKEECQKHKWYESEKAGKDLGELAIQDWMKKYWPKLCREKWIKHINGIEYWEDFEEKYFNILNKNIHSNKKLVEKVVLMLASGLENLDVILWATDHDLLEDSVSILKILGLNSARLSFYN